MIAIVTGCRKIFPSNLPSKIILIIKSIITPNKRGSVGRLTPILKSKSLKLIDKGVRKTIMSKSISREKIYKSANNRTTGITENQ